MQQSKFTFYFTVKVDALIKSHSQDFLPVLIIDQPVEVVEELKHLDTTLVFHFEFYS